MYSFNLWTYSLAKWEEGGGGYIHSISMNYSLNSGAELFI